MKLSILQQDLLPVLSSVSRSVGVRSNLPVLGNILLTTDGQKLKVAATNLEVGVIKVVNCEVSDTGDITVPAKTILEIIQGLGSLSLGLETNLNTLNITAGKFKASINGISSSEFPVIPITEGEGIMLKKEVLLSCAQILFASAVDEGRPTLNGVLSEAHMGKFDFVATDGFRLSHRRIDIPQNLELKSIIPRRTFEEVIRLIEEDLAGEDDMVEVSTSKNQNQVIFKIGQTILSSRLIEGNFPSWEKIIPENITSRTVLERAEFLSATKLASVFAKSETNIIKIKVKKEGLSISSEAKEIGSQTNEVEAQVEGEELEIAFNAKFLLEVIQATNAIQLMVEFSGPLSPTIIKPVGIEGLEYIIMPVKTN